MAYDNTPGVKGSYLDGSLKTPTGTTQPKILSLGSASGGLTNELFNVTNVRRTEVEFGADSEVMYTVHEAIAQKANNIAIMRIGGKRGSFVFTDSAGNTLTIIPELRDNAALSRYSIAMDGTGTANRIVLYDVESEEHVYDSSEILALDEGVLEISDTGIDLFSVGTVNDPLTYIALADLVVGDFTVNGTATAASVVATQGTDGVGASSVEKYAALNSAYHLLDYKDADFVIPRGVYHNSPNVVDDGAVANFFKGVPVAGAANDELGYLWQYIYRGKVYTYFTDSDSYFTDLTGAAASTVTVNTDLVLTADKDGIGGDGISIVIDDGGAAGPTVTITEPTATTLLITVTDDGSSDTSTAVTAINTALGLYTLSNGELASTLVTATGGAATLLVATASTPLAGGAGGHVLTHEDLTGDSVPSAVAARFAAGADAELRECNFTHQLGSFCERASTSWKAMLGSISTLGPSGLSRQNVADWVGSAPTYTVGPNGTELIVDAPADNGSGLLGDKLLAGLAISSAGYRNGAISSPASSTDALAFGGLIKTVGASLPNADDWPLHSYGIDDSDERVDSNGAPVDLGKHVSVTYAWPIHRNSYNGGSVYRGPIHATYLARLAVMPEKEEPIGPNGIVGKLASVPRIHATQIDQLARIRMIGLIREEGLGFTFVNSKTAAHPDSDYTRISTIRCVNRELQGVRRICRQYLGKEFSAQKLIALQSAIDVFLKGEKDAGFNQGAAVSLNFTRAEKILGRLHVRLKMVPPFSIEAINVEMSLAADESEL